MPTVPVTGKFKASSADILNAIRNGASANYKDYIPAASDLNSIHTIGNILMDYPALQNEFLNALVNRIGKVILSSKSYNNPWAFFKRGQLDYGETVEEIFVNLANPENYDMSEAETKVFKRRIPDVRAAFHVQNFRKFYPITVSRENLNKAFLSWDGVEELITRIIDTVYTSVNYDEFQVMKYVLARNILNGRLYPVTVSAVTAANANSIMGKIKSVSDAMTFMSKTYNAAGVFTHSEKSDQFLITSTAANSVLDIEVLAKAFNLSYAEFTGHNVMVDSFGEFDTDRLAKLFEDDDDYEAFTDSEITALKAIPAVLVDRNYLMIFDSLFEMREIENPQGLYWTYFLHVWKTFSTSPFANCAVFVTGSPAVSAVSVSPATATISYVPAELMLSTTVTASNFAPQTVEYTIKDSSSEDVDAEYAYVTPQGVVHLTKDCPDDTYTVTATSTVNSSASDTCVITVDTD